jgi:hypothetical protein
MVDYSQKQIRFSRKRNAKSFTAFSLSIILKEVRCGKRWAPVGRENRKVPKSPFAPAKVAEENAAFAEQKATLQFSCSVGKG